MHDFIFPQDEVQRSNKVSRGNDIVASGETLSTEPLRLSIYRANGGMIVETRVYDRQKDRSQNQLHIVSHDEDLGHSIAKIITMESLRG
jgi:hypothetical protein